MRTALKIVSGIILVLISLVLAAFLAINTVDWNRHREFLVQTVARYSPIRIDEVSGIRVKLWRSLEFELAHIKLHMDAPDKALESFSSGPMQIRVAMGPLLLKRQLLVQSFTSEGARLRWKAQPESKAEPTENEESPGEVLKKLPQIFINLAAVTDAQFHYQALDQKKPLLLSIDRLQLAAGKDDPTPEVSGQGKFGDLPWQLEGATGTLEAFENDVKPFPIRVRAKLGQHSAEARGSYRFADGVGDFMVNAKGPNFEQIKKLFELNIGSVPAYRVSFAAHIEAQDYKFEDIDVKLGQSSLTGTLRADLRQHRPRISGNLVAPRVVQKELSGIFQTDRRYKPDNEPPKPDGQYFSDKPIDVSMLRRLNMDLSLKLEKFQGEKAGTAIEGAEATVKLEKGRLEIKPLKIAIAQGTIGGHFLLDGRKQPLDVDVALGARNMKLAQLLQPLTKEVPVFKVKPSDMARGVMTGQMNLTMQGKSPLDLARSLNGPIELAMEDGALAGAAVEAFGIDITQTIGNLFKKHSLYDIQCALTAFEAKSGVISTKAFLIATKDTSILGKGSLSLVDNKVDFRLEAHPHDFSIGSFRSPIYIRGPLNDLQVGLERKEILTRSGLALALGTLVNPIAAVVPLIDTGLDKKGKCRSVMDELHAVVGKAARLSGQPQANGG